MGFFFGLSISIIFFAAWLQHVITTIGNQDWVFLLAGAIMFPIAVVHGIGIWFGAW